MPGTCPGHTRDTAGTYPGHRHGFSRWGSGAVEDIYEEISRQQNNNIAGQIDKFEKTLFGGPIKKDPSLQPFGMFCGTHFLEYRSRALTM